MGIGTSVFLIALGAILTFALEVSVAGIDLSVVGVILMLVGIAGLAFSLMVLRPRRQATGDSVVTEERVVRGRPRS